MAEFPEKAAKDGKDQAKFLPSRATFFKLRGCRLRSRDLKHSGEEGKREGVYPWKAPGDGHRGRPASGIGIGEDEGGNHEGNVFLVVVALGLGWVDRSFCDRYPEICMNARFGAFCWA